MKFLMLILASMLLVGCATVQPKYKIGDCVNMSIMNIDKEGKWDSSGFHMGAFKVVSYMYEPVVNQWRDERRPYQPMISHTKTFYVVRYINWTTGQMYETESLIPMSDLDGFRFASVFWEYGEQKWRCNKYEASKELK